MNPTKMRRQGRGHSDTNEDVTADKVKKGVKPPEKDRKRPLRQESNDDYEHNDSDEHFNTRKCFWIRTLLYNYMIESG